MTGNKIITLSFVLLMLGVNSYSQDTSTPPSTEKESPSVTTDDMTADELLQKVITTYKALATYQTQGQIIMESEVEGHKTKNVTTFSILLKKPFLYLISWTHKTSSTADSDSSGAVWNDGTQPYDYMGNTNTQLKMDDDEFTIARAGAPSLIPSLFFSIFSTGPSAFTQLKDLVIEGTETVEGETCFILSGSTLFSKRIHHWISKETFFIRKFEQARDSSDGDPFMSEPTDEQLERLIKMIGQEVTEENKKNARDIFKKQLSTTTIKNFSNSYTEIYTSAATPQVSKSDFTFSLPEGALRQDFNDFIWGRDNAIPVESENDKNQ